MFHCLARDSADLLVGGAGASRSKHAWRQVYRAVDHGHTRKACADGRVISQFPKAIEDFANAFVTMQKKRHDADYDPYSRFTKSEVTQDIATVEAAVGAFRLVSASDRRAFCAFVLFRQRSV
ncbi:MAG: hypothetical protein IT548_05860 [Alphaproteobacteria bacterium]|nr:hypothetical protein [Alphaproteobacteria bacterium]